MIHLENNESYPSNKVFYYHYKFPSLKDVLIVVQ